MKRGGGGEGAEGARETDVPSLLPVDSAGGQRRGRRARAWQAGCCVLAGWGTSVPEVSPWQPRRPQDFREKGPRPPAPEPGSHLDLCLESELAADKNWTAQLPSHLLDPQQALAWPCPGHAPATGLVFPPDPDDLHSMT